MKSTITCAAMMIAVLYGNSHLALAAMVPAGNGNDTAPGDDPGFLNVGVSPGNIGSVTYLGNRWLITAGHNPVVAGNTVSLNSISYTVEAGSIHVLQNPDLSNTDLKMFRITTDPGLPSLAISNSTPGVNDQVTMIGNGLGHTASPPTQLYWDVSGSSPNFTWTPVGAPGEESGFQGTSSTRDIRWGDNLIHQGTQSVDLGALDVHAYTTRFDDTDYTSVAGLTDEGQALAGDSGGGVFFKNGLQWELSGIMVAAGVFEDQPANTAVFGNLTIIADLSVYRAQIESLMLVPEPGTGVLAFCGMLLAGRQAARWRRKRG